MRTISKFPFLVLLLALCFAPSTWGAEARILTANDLATMGGTDFDGGAGDYLLRSDSVEAVVLALGTTSDFEVPLAPEALPSRGVLIDVGTPGDRNDQLNEIHQVLNLAPDSLVIYLGPEAGFPGPIFTNDGDTASITVSGIALFGEASTPASPTLFVETTYSATDGEPWIRIDTTVTNGGAVELPVFSIADADILVARGRVPYQPFPGRGPKNPPLDFADPFPSLGVWPFVASRGNNGPEDGVGEVCYAFLAPSLTQQFIGVASQTAIVASRFFDLGAVAAGFPPMLQPGESMSHSRRLVVGRSNTIEACADIFLPELFRPIFGLDARLGFIGRVVDGNGDPVSGAHLFFDNIVPGSPDFTPLVSVLDENQDGIADGVIPASGGSPLPATHTVTDADGRFKVVLQVLADPSTVPTVYGGRAFAENRDPVDFGPLTIDLPAFQAQEEVDVGDIVLSATGTLEVDVERIFPGGARRAMPAKLAIYGTGGTPDPDFGDQFLGLSAFSGLSRTAGDGLDPLTAGNTLGLTNTFTGQAGLGFVYSADGDFELDLRPGTYRVYASRGLEYEIAETEVTVVEGETARVEMGLRRVVTTAGFVSVGAHVHATGSFDSSVPVADRVVSFAAAGVETVISTEHDALADYAPAIRELGLRGEIRSIVGSEITGGLPVPASLTGGVDAFPESIGHWNAWPLIPVPGNRRHGAPQDEFVGPGTAIDRLRGMDSLLNLDTTPDTATIGEWLAAAQAGQPGTPGEGLPADDEVVMLNHPRAGLTGLVVIGLFSSLANPGGDPLTGGFDASQPIDTFPNNLLLAPSLYNKAVVGPAGTDTTALSFDAIELINGPNTDDYLVVREDWFNLLDQGLHKTGFAVSDSHRPVMENPGFGRTYVALSSETPRSLDEKELTASILAGRVFGTTGPVIRFDIPSDVSTTKMFFNRFFDGIGTTALATAEEITLRIRVEAAPWIPVEEVRIYKNGELFEALDVVPGRVLNGPVVRLQRNLRVPGGDADSYWVIEAGVRIDENGAALNPEVLETAQRVEPGLVPLAFTNPIFVDRQGDGYTPPGL